jgi:predicted RNA-binding Zn-ribbon protein involved in translation (DUF1610 family)
MLLKIIFILAIVAVMMIAIVIIDIIMPRYCKSCGTKMIRLYDEEEDAEVYQCPQCGRSYLIK